jgi:DnaJ-class molecular chaperone
MNIWRSLQVGCRRLLRRHAIKRASGGGCAAPLRRPRCPNCRGGGFYTPDARLTGVVRCSLCQGTGERREVTTGACRRNDPI